MTVYTHPNLCPSRFGLTLLGNVHVNQSKLNSAIKRSEFPGDLWFARGEWPQMSLSEFALVEAFWNGFRGQAHTLRIWHMLRPVPYGTMRGTPVVGAARVAGSNDLIITSSTSGQTLRPGDMIGVPVAGSKTQLLQVRTSFTDGTTISVATHPPLRRDAVVGGLIVWNKPTIDCVLIAPPILAGRVKFADGFTIEALEIPFV